jgi:hypothetical protein
MVIDLKLSQLAVLLYHTNLLYHIPYDHSGGITLYYALTDPIHVFARLPERYKISRSL